MFVLDWKNLITFLERTTNKLNHPKEAQEPIFNSLLYGSLLGDSNSIYYKTETIALVSNYLFSVWGKKTGERFALKERPVPLLTRGGLKEENVRNHKQIPISEQK